MPDGADWVELFEAYAAMPDYRDPENRSPKQAEHDRRTADLVRTLAREMAEDGDPNFSTTTAERIALWFEAGDHREFVTERASPDGTEHPYDWRLDHAYPEAHPDEAEEWAIERGAKLDEMADAPVDEVDGDGLDLEFGGAP